MERNYVIVTLWVLSWTWREWSCRLVCWGRRVRMSSLDWRCDWVVPPGMTERAPAVPITATHRRRLLLHQRRRNGGSDGDARPRNVETTGARVSFRPRNISTHFCMLLNFHSLSLCCLHTIKTSHSVGTTGRILGNEINKTYIPSENFENRVTIEHLCELHISKTCDCVITVRLRNVKIVPTPLCYT